jgi:hypothetical protein
MGYTENLHEAHKRISQETHFSYLELMSLHVMPYNLYAGFRFLKQLVSYLVSLFCVHLIHSG